MGDEKYIEVWHRLIGSGMLFVFPSIAKVSSSIDMYIALDEKRIDTQFFQPSWRW